MEEKALQAALDAVTTEQAVKLVTDLIDISSPTGEELECARFLHGYLEAAGIEAHLQETEEGRANVIGVIRGAGDGPTLMLNGHLDTTYYGEWEVDYPLLGVPKPNDQPKSFEIDGGIYGLGAFNMKGGVAAIFLALRALKQADVQLRGAIMASGVAGESEKAPVRGAFRDFVGKRFRGSGHGTQFLITHWEPIDFAIVAEPSDLYVVNAQAGYLFVRISLFGQVGYLTTGGAPLARPGLNAIEDATEVIRALAQWAPEYTARHIFDTGMGSIQPLVNVGAVEGGWPFFPSHIPGLCVIYVNVRLTPTLGPEQALAELEEQLRRLAAQRPGLRYQVEVFACNAPSTVTPVDSALCRTAVRVMEEQMGFPTRPFGAFEANPSNDTNVFRRHGVPAVKCGPKTRTEPNGEEMTRLHGVHVYREDIVQAARFYVRMAFELCGRSRGDIDKL